MLCFAWQLSAALTIDPNLVLASTLDATSAVLMQVWNLLGFVSLAASLRRLFDSLLSQWLRCSCVGCQMENARAAAERSLQAKANVVDAVALMEQVALNMTPIPRRPTIQNVVKILLRFS